MKYRTVIFDLDGTLLDTIEDLTDSVNYVMNSFGFQQYSIEQIKSFVGHGIRKLLENAVPGGIQNEKFEEAYCLFREYYTEHCCEKTGPYEQIVELLEDLKKQSINMAIVSNKNDSAVEELKNIFFAEYIHTAIGQSETTRKKPAPDTVYKAMEELHADKESTLYVGDSEVDKMTADAAGIDCVLVSWGFRKKENLEKLEPVKVIDRPEELMDYVL